MYVSEDDKIIREEIEAILEDIKALYIASGKKASGEFGRGLEAVYEPNKGTIRGYVYLAGRGPTKKGHKEGEPYLVEKILDWIKIRGIKPREEKMSIKSLAWAITKSIHKKGTNPSNFMKIYEQVITPQRINSIIDRIAKLNVNRIITEIRAELEILARNV